ncbi:hypothetical protein F4780DRAFT_785448 [Xylariomycetidae sp. FL0641]|nr:hypothetical protein F4780DRAFT_785448 [Xylariomycetidae sp. FL0641]
MKDYARGHMREAAMEVDILDNPASGYLVRTKKAGFSGQWDVGAVFTTRRARCFQKKHPDGSEEAFGGIETSGDSQDAPIQTFGDGRGTPILSFGNGQADAHVNSGNGEAQVEGWNTYKRSSRRTKSHVWIASMVSRRIAYLINKKLPKMSRIATGSKDDATDSGSYELVSDYSAATLYNVFQRVAGWLDHVTFRTSAFSYPVIKISHKIADNDKAAPTSYGFSKFFVADIMSKRSMSEGRASTHRCSVISLERAYGSRVTLPIARTTSLMNKGPGQIELQFNFRAHASTVLKSTDNIMQARIDNANPFKLMFRHGNVCALRLVDVDFDAPKKPKVNMTDELLVEKTTNAISKASELQQTTNPNNRNGLRTRTMEPWTAGWDEGWGPTPYVQLNLPDAANGSAHSTESEDG